MKNPLMKRIPRELTGDWSKYLIVFLFLTLTIGFISGFLVAGDSMIIAYNNSFKDYNIEYGHFSLDEEIHQSFKKKLTQYGVSIEDMYYADLPIVRKKEINGSTEGTIRIYKDRKGMNRICVMKGKMPKKENEIAIDRMFADNNRLSIGDTVTVDQKKYKITALVALSDYSALYKDNSEMMFDSIAFSVGIVTDQAFHDIDASKLTYNYSWQYDEEPKDEEAETKCADTFMEHLYEETQAADIEIKDYLPRYANQAIQFTGDDMGGDRGMIIVLLYILIIMIGFVFSITIRHTIVKEATVIGTLRASGYTKGELLLHYLIPPVVITVVAALIGNVLGYSWFKNMVADMYYGSYSLPTYVTIWNADAFVLTTVVPAIMMLILNVIVIANSLKLSPLRFIRRDLSRRQRKKAVKLPHFRFLSRFRIRVILQNIPNYLILLFGIWFSSILLFFGCLMKPLLLETSDTMVDSMFAKYQYMLTTQIETKDPDAERFTMASYTYIGKTRTEDVTFYGVQKNSRYITYKIPSDGILISSMLADKYELKVGDTIRFKETYDTKEYQFKVKGIADYSASLAVFMNNKLMTKTFGFHKDTALSYLSDPELLVEKLGSPDTSEYYNGYMCNKKIKDIPDKYISTCITKSDITKMADQLMHSMGSVFGMIKYFALILAALLIYLLTKIVLEKNTVPISLCKILGYDNTEIARLYLVSTTWVVVGSVIFSLALAGMMMKGIFRIFLMDYNGWITVHIPMYLYPVMFVMMMAAYLVVALLQFRKIKKIPMDQALKNVE